MPLLPDTRGKFDWDQILQQFRVVAGSPGTAADKVEAWAE